MKTELGEDGYPCKDCPVRKAFAEAFDIHMSGEDCMYECEIYENFKKNRDEEEDE